MGNRRPFLSASGLQTASYATRRVATSLAEAPHWLIIETYGNTAMQQNNIWSIAFEACTKVIMKVVAEATVHIEYYRLKPVPGSRTSR